MNPNKIQNPKTQTPNTPQMNDRDFINDILAYEKYMVSSYGIAGNEASHQALFQEIQSLCTEAHQMQRSLFDMMFKKGWYALEAEDPQKIQQAEQQFTKYTAQFPHTPPMQ
ncbi:spore coat protein [Fictibacillus sp. Mic-4]|uniref:spore coat protein n=1 Tax=Fictibacillus TaxID=1329200 RepID=UPI00047D94F8|nr:spore coat protein [Fictibacillus gelatini]